MITVKIASIPERISQLEVTIEHFLNKVNRIEIYLNNYPRIPSFLNHKKIGVFTSKKYGDIGDIGKFYQIEQVYGYILTIDDDLIYPLDYVDSMIRKIDFYQKEVFICVHGNILPKQQLTSYYKDKLGVHFERKVEKDIRVDIPGTGTLGFHSDNIKISQQIFLSPNMTDIWLAAHAKQNNIPIISVERPENWVLQVRDKAFQKSIYQASFRRDFYQTQVVNDVFFCSKL